MEQGSLEGRPEVSIPPRALLRLAANTAQHRKKRGALSCVATEHRNLCHFEPLEGQLELVCLVSLRHCF